MNGLYTEHTLFEQTSGHPSSSAFRGLMPFPHLSGIPITVPIPEIISAKNARAWVSMDFIQNKYSAPIAIEKIKILGAL